MDNQIAYEARAEFLIGSNETGILVIHGFSGSTQSMRQIAYDLHKQGYTVSLPCLKGHGTSPEDMEKTSYIDWVSSVTEALDELKTKVKQVFVLGLSMGGTLTLYCAIHFKLAGIITINAAIDLPAFAEMYQHPKTPRFIASIGSDIKKADTKELAYDRVPKKCLNSILQLCHIVKSDLAKVTCPALVFKSLEDHVVPPDNQDQIYAGISSASSELIELYESYHVATIDNDFPLILDKTLSFIKQNS